MSADTLALALSWLAEDEPRRFKFDSAWLFLVTPVTLFAAATLIRGLRAEDGVRKNCAEKIVAIKDTIVSDEIHPALANIIVNIYPYFPPHIAEIIVEKKEYLTGQPGSDPKFETTRILGYRTSFAASLNSLEEHYGSIHRATSIHGRLVTHQLRCGAAMAVFLVGWVYFSCFLMLPNIAFPNALTIAAVIVMALSLGWAAAEWWGENRENNALSTLVRQTQVSKGQTQ